MKNLSLYLWFATNHGLQYPVLLTNEEKTKCLVRDISSLNGFQSVFLSEENCVKIRHIDGELHISADPSAIWRIGSNGEIIALSGHHILYDRSASTQCEIGNWFVKPPSSSLGEEQYEYVALDENLSSIEGCRLPMEEEILKFKAIPLNSAKEVLEDLELKKVKRKLDYYRYSFRGIEDSTQKLASLEVLNKEGLEKLNWQKEELNKAQSLLADSISQVKKIVKPMTGEGLLVRYYTPSSTEENSNDDLDESYTAKTIIRKLALPPITISQLGLNNLRIWKVKITGEFRPLWSAPTVFRFYNLTGDIKVKVAGQTILNQWTAPIEGKALESSPISLNEDELVALEITSEGLSETLTFTKGTVAQRSANANIANETEIPKPHLYPANWDPVCFPQAGVSVFENCEMTFRELLFRAADFKKDELMEVYCPAFCYQGPPSKDSVIGDGNCYHLESSVCHSARHASVLSERGGTVVVMIGNQTSRGSFREVENNGFSSALGSASDECASVRGADETGSPYILISATVVPLKELTLLLNKTFGEASGRSLSVLDKDFAVIKDYSWPGPSVAAFNSIGLQCAMGNNQHKIEPTTNDSISINADAVLSLTKSPKVAGTGTHVKFPVLSDLLISRSASFHSVDGKSAVSLAANPHHWTSFISPANGWSRFACYNKEKPLFVYVKFSNGPEKLQFPSRTVTCETSLSHPFKERSILESAVVRCPKNCDASDGSSVGGSIEYSSNSSICKSAIHSGVIASKGGGVVRITPRLSLGTDFTGVYRNGISSKGFIASSTPSTLYELDVSRGEYCTYPQSTQYQRISYEVEDSEEQSLELNDPNSEDPNPNSTSFMSVISPYSFRNTMPSISTALSNALLSINDKKGEVDKLKDGLDTVNNESGSLSNKLNQAQSIMMEKLHKTEEELLSLEIELEDQFISPNDKMAVGVSTLFEDFSIWDSASNSLGPSNWKSDPIEGLISQSSPIYSSILGTAAIYRHGWYSHGFLKANLDFGNSYGTALVIFHWIDEKREVVNGNFQTFQPSANCTTQAPLEIFVDWGVKFMRAFVGSSENPCATGAPINSTRQVPLIGNVGIGTNALGLNGVATFRDIMIGPAYLAPPIAPQSSNSILEVEIGAPITAFENDEAREIEFEETKETEPTDPSSLNQTAAPLSSSSFSPSASSFGPDGYCLDNYTESFSQPLEMWWQLPSQSSFSWVLTDKFIAGASSTSSNGTIGVLLLQHPPCFTTKDEIRFEVALQIADNSEAGIVIRAGPAVGEYEAILIKRSGLFGGSTSIRVLYSDGLSSENKMELFDSVLGGQQQSSSSAAWVNITVVDRLNAIETFIAQKKVFHQRVNRPLNFKKVGLALSGLEGGGGVKYKLIQLK